MASIRRRGFISDGSGLSLDDILQYATDEMRSYITAFLKGIREEFLVSTLDVSVTNGVVAAPVRAVGAALRTIGWVLSNGNERFLPRIEPENAGGLEGATGEPSGYMFQGNNVILLPAPTSGTVRLRYQQRPGQLVSTDACALISSDGPGALDVDTRPSGWDETLFYDIVSHVPNFTLAAMDLEGEWTSPTVFTPDVTLDTADVTINDYMCLAGETCIPQVPPELFDLLAQATAYKIAQAMGSQRTGNIKSGLDELEKQMTQILSPRSDGSARPVISRSRVGRWNLGW